MNTFVKNISSIYCYPINFNLTGDQYTTKQTPIYFDNGLFFNVHEFLKNAEDIKINKKSGMFLTNLLSAKEIFSSNSIPKDSEKLEFIKSPIVDVDGKIISLSGSSTINQGWFQFNKSSYSQQDSFKFIFENDYVYIEAEDEKYLTVSNNDLYFDNKNILNINNQKFNYFLGDESIILFQYNSNYSKVVTKSSNKRYVLGNYSTGSNLTIPLNTIIKFVSYKEENLNYDNIKNSFFVTYKTSPLLNQKEIIPTTESFEDFYKQNYLSLFPVEYPIIKDDIVTYNLQIHGLKNYQTPEYNYSKGAKYIPETSVVRRLYRNIFTGTNQNRGSDKLYLGYTSNTYEKSFQPDTETTFRYPPISNRLPINYSGLIEDGAYAGETPYISDRICFKNINYSETTFNGNVALSSIRRETGTWLCSWLYQSPNGSKWMDRYYNSAYYTIEQALSASIFIYNKKLHKDIPTEVWDIDSELILEPDNQYSFFRAGKETSIKFLEFLNSDTNNPLGAKVLDINNFENSPLNDSSNYKNNGLLFNTKSENLNKDYIVLDGTNHSIFPAKNILLERNYLTLSLWINVKDWGNITGDQIIGNYYESGFGLINESSLTAPILSLIDSTSGIAYNLNYRLLQLDNIDLPKIVNAEYNFVQRLQDYSYWIIDAKNRNLRKYNVEGKIQYQTTIPLASATYINQVEIDKNENLYLYDSSNGKIAIVNTFGVCFSAININKNYNRIEINLNSQIVPSYGTCSCIDKDNNLWDVVGGNLYKNGIIYANVGPMQQIVCDASNNIWMVHIKDKITKFNIATESFEFTKRFGRNIFLPDDCFEYEEQYRFLNFIKSPKLQKGCVETNDKTEDLAVLIDDIDKQIYLLTADGFLVSRLNLNALFVTDRETVNDFRNFKALGDFTGYQYLRKYSTARKNLSWKFKIAEPNGRTGSLFKLEYDVKDLPPGWHNFTFVFDSQNGNAKYYIDTFLVDVVSFEKNKYQIYYDYKSSILLGAANIKNFTLNDILKVDDAYKFVGEIGRIVMFNKALTKGQIEQIYYSSDFAIDRSAIDWNISLGERNYIEEIEHWFKMQLPSNKSKFFNLNIHNLNAPDDVKALIEESIKINIEKISPAHTKLYSINWYQS